jgi:hypothetical protein
MSSETAELIAALSSKLGWWDWVAYISTGLVFVGVAGESIAELTRWISRYSEEWNDWIKKASALLLIVGLAAELISLVRTSELTGRLVATLNQEAVDAHLETARIEKEYAPRSLAPRQLEVIADKLKQFAGERINIDTYRDVEPWFIADRIHIACAA